MPAGYVQALQGPIGRALHAAHRAGGSQLDYTLVSDTSTMTTISLPGIFARKTPLVRTRDMLGGRFQEFMSAAGNLSAEALPIFQLSREALLSGGTYYEPTFYDTFNETGQTQKFYVAGITEISQFQEGWFLMVTTQFRDYARG